MYRRQFVAGMLFCGGVAALGSDRAAARSRGRVYLLRGLLNLTPRFDVLGEKLKARGFDVSLHSHGEAPNLADQASSEYRSGRQSRIILIGHSLGGTAVLTMAEQLARSNVPVSLVVVIDAPTAPPVPSNVRWIVDLYLSDGIGVPVERGKNFHGRMDNVNVKSDPDMGHFAIASSAKMQKKVIDYVLASN